MVPEPVPGVVEALALPMPGMVEVPEAGPGTGVELPRLELAPGISEVPDPEPVPAVELLAREPDAGVTVPLALGLGPGVEDELDPNPVRGIVELLDPEAGPDAAVPTATSGQFFGRGTMAPPDGGPVGCALAASAIVTTPNVSAAVANRFIRPQPFSPQRVPRLRRATAPPIAWPVSGAQRRNRRHSRPRGVRNDLPEGTLASLAQHLGAGLLRSRRADGGLDLLLLLGQGRSWLPPLLSSDRKPDGLTRRVLCQLTGN
jgi:hypothetical protein